MNKINLTSENAVLQSVDLFLRKHILVTSEEEVRPRGYDDTAYFKWLNFRYIEKFKEMIPYHYAITVDGVLYALKSDFIGTEASIFATHTDDIIVYVEGKLKKLTSAQQSSLVDLCVFVCQKYLMSQDDILFFPHELLNDTSTTQQRELIQQLVIGVLEQKIPSDIVKNSFAKEKREVGVDNEKAEFIYLNSEMTIKELSEMTGIPQSILSQQNQHLI